MPFMQFCFRSAESLADTPRAGNSMASVRVCFGLIELCENTY